MVLQESKAIGLIGRFVMTGLILAGSCSAKKVTTVSMPLVEHMEGPPVIAVIYHDESYTLVPYEPKPTDPPPVPKIRIIFAAWQDGTVIWAKDAETGRPPFFKGKIPFGRVKAFLARLEKERVFDNLTHPCMHFDEDCVSIAISYGPRQFDVISEHEIEERHRQVLQPAVGENVPLKGRSKNQVLATQPVGYQRFRKTWDRIRDGVKDLIPRQGERLETVNICGWTKRK